MRIRWTPTAAADLEHIKDYLSEHNPQFAQSTVLDLYETIRSLKASPHRGRVGREEGTRELVFTRLPYIVAYRIKEQTVEILHIFHGARDRP
ncbi:MAG TPA: type II toxin-antitoxin system RelE/ParE family toxin [Candidatus Acidoferrum sp.]|nr:type II toxin-antitoxin system RelE/ParE family toxin [Candidatus Acidoferrum sp.]